MTFASGFHLVVFGLWLHFLMLSLTMVCYATSRTTYPGFGLWTIGTCLNAIGFLLVGLRGIIPQFWSIIVANVLLAIGIAFYYSGFRMFAALPSRRSQQSLVLFFYVILFLPIFTYIYPSQTVRVCLISTYVAAGLLLCYLVLSDFTGKRSKSRCRILSFSLLGLSITYFLRALAYPFYNNTIYAFSQGTFDEIVIMATFMLSTGMVMGMMQFNTEKLEEELHRSKERFQNLVENTNDWIWEVDAQGSYTYVSPQILSILGYRPEEVVGKKPFDFMPEEESQKIKRYFWNCFREKKPLVNLVNVCTHKSGRLVTLETSGVPVLNAQGEVTHYRGIDRDISGRHNSESEREALIRELREALNNVHVLKGLLPICVTCKKIRDDKGYWNILEAYIQSNSDVVFSHGICPECSDSLYGHEPWYKKIRQMMNSR